MNRDHQDQALDAGENLGSNSSRETSIGELIRRRLGRREALYGAGAMIAAGATRPAMAQGGNPSSFSFPEVAHRSDATHHVPEGYEAQVLIRWGDPVVAGAPSFDPLKLDAAAQEKQFGYNCDYLGLYPLPLGGPVQDRFLMVVNHEYTNTGLMFSGLGPGREAMARADKSQVAVELAAHGGSVIEIRRERGRWSVVPDSRYARRISLNTPMRFSGPAAGHDKLKTSSDPTGRAPVGMLNQCAGGGTPWGTWLTTEENFNLYFSGDLANAPDRKRYERYGVARTTVFHWGKHVDRFDIGKEPNEPNRFGWIVEIDPYDPTWTPVKRTALGRAKHEGCTYALCRDGRVAFYMGDDERFEYIYKFVTARPWSPTDRAANRDLLDDGTLFVARFDEGGKMEWLPMVHGQGPLTATNGFASQGDVVIEKRRAADLLKPTPMDRPEDIETNPVNGRVYAILTNNDRRTAERVDAANPRGPNKHGHIVEMTPDGGDHAASVGTWAIFMAFGKPGTDPGTVYHPGISANGWLSSPDNCAFDSRGRMWIATDAPATEMADGVWTTDLEGAGRGLTRCFYQAPSGAEVCGPILSPDDRTLFLAIQHPGQDPGSTFDKPSTRWPDFKEGMPPRPSVIAIVKKDGSVVGS